MERGLVEQSDVSFAAYYEVMAGPLHGVSLIRALTSLVKLMVGVVQSFGILLRRRPNVTLLTGGWANVPLALVMWLLRVPSVIYLPDIEPGLTIRFLQRFARKVAITVPDSAQYFRDGQAVVTGYPLRQRMLRATRDEGLNHFGLDSTRKTLLVTGGSQGARNINIAIIENLTQLLDCGLQIIHLTGTGDWERARQQAASLGELSHYHPLPYCHEMGLALAAADIVVCRSGASILGEQTFFGLAAILVPYPYAWRYQKVNADWLESRGAGIYVADEDLTVQLVPVLKSLLDDPERLATMQARARALAQGDGADNIAQLLLDLARN